MLLLSCFAKADVVNLIDDFNNPALDCTPAEAPGGFTSCDVVGDRADFDIEKAHINFNATATTIDYYLNFNNGAVNLATNTLSGFTDGGVNLLPGDILFTGAGGAYFGIAMSSHDGLTAGALYQLFTPVTAQVALGNPDAYYRNSRYVLIDNSPASPNPTFVANANSFTVSANGNGSTTGAEYKVSIALSAAGSQFLWDQANANGGSLNVFFQSADCGNDTLDGTLAASEPMDFSIAFGACGLIALAAYRRRLVA